MAPFRRTARNTSDNASIAAPQTIEHEGRTSSHSNLGDSPLHWPPNDRSLFILLEGLVFHEHSVRTLLLRRSSVRNERNARSDGLLPLPILPSLVGRAGECILALEAGVTQNYPRWVKYRHVQQDICQLPKVVQEMRWPFVHRPSHNGLSRHLRCHAAGAEIRTRAPRQLPGGRPAYQGRQAEDAGHAERDGRV